MDPRKFLAPEILYGVGSRFRAGAYATNIGISRALLVSDPGVIAAGWMEQVRESLIQSGIESVLFDGVSPNPRTHECQEGRERYLAEACDGIVVVGGGSPMDCAKAIGILAVNEGDIRDFEGVDTIPTPCPPQICIPTTSGSSADVSQFCIINDTGRRVKMAIVSRILVPDVSLIDPETTCTMDAGLTAATGLDALTHAAEAIVSNARSALTDLHAQEAIRLIWNNLVGAIEQPENLEYRNQMSLASLNAGLAFSNASLGAVHAMAHALGGFLDMPHGECNAILLPHVVERNFDAEEAGYRAMAAAMDIPQQTLSAPACKARLLESIRSLQRQAGITQCLGDCGVSPGDLAALAKVAELDACLVTNPCELDVDELEKIYARAL
jgi:alcohol dehydrogenase class IV